MKIITHDGLFHADEVFAIALLKIIFKKVEIIRTRNLENTNADLYIDVGGKFDNNKYFDHHFQEFKEYHDFRKRLPKASFGIIFDKFIHHLFDDENQINALRVSLVIPIDAFDNGIKIATKENMNYANYTVSNVINAFNNRDLDESRQFLRAVNFAKTILNNAINSIKNNFKDKNEIIKILDDNINNKYIVLDRYYNVGLFIKNPKYDNIKHMIFPESNHYRVVSFKNFKTNELRAPFPQHWGGLENEELDKVSNIKNCIFCHKALFIASNKTLEGAIKMAEACYKN